MEICLPKKEVSAPIERRTIQKSTHSFIKTHTLSLRGTSISVYLVSGGLFSNGTKITMLKLNMYSRMYF